MVATSTSRFNTGFDLGTTRCHEHVVDELRRDAAERMGSALWGE